MPRFILKIDRAELTRQRALLDQLTHSLQSSETPVIIVPSQLDRLLGISSLCDEIADQYDSAG
jgi:hypothetical protein